MSLCRLLKMDGRRTAWERSLQHVVILVVVSVSPTWAQSKPPVELQQGEHISIIGNTLAERMQHDGWLESGLQTAFPQHRLSIRNLGFSGDELTLRLRSRDFGTPDEWLTRCGTDVVFAFFGYNESFGGEEGLPKFRQDLDNFIKQTLSQQYNGKTAPRLVLFSPIAHENLNSPHLPDGSENNHRLAAYTAAMAEVARENHVGFVDLFRPSLELYENHEQPLTINGVHLNEFGNRLIAEVILKSFGVTDAVRPEFEALRQAVLDKNYHWFQRYRTTDGYSIYGGRADLKFHEGQTNREVMQREMEILDAMTANRDERIWALARSSAGRRPPDGGTGELAPPRSPVDDSNTPPFIPVITNKPGAGPDGTHLFLSGEQAIELMTVAPGMQVNLFADEATFPELVSPVQMAFDPRGRLFVAAWESYPHWKPKDILDDKLLILEDTNGDGKADVCKTFAGGLHNPTGFEFWNGGVLVGCAPDIWFLQDTTGDDVADVRIRVLHGFDSADTHHAANSFVFSPGGALFFQEGTFHHTQIESPWRRPVRSANAGVFRFEPLTFKVENYVAFGFANPHGHVFDRWGQDIIHDGTGAVPYHATLFSGHLEYPAKHPKPPQVYQQRTRPCGGTEILSSGHFPDENQGNLLVSNVIGFQGILQYKLEDKGSSFTATEVDPIVVSTDPHFRPVDLEVGPDGAIYFVDWQNPIIGHMQHNLRDPSRDRKHGRVYRVTYSGRPLLTPPDIAGEPVENLVKLLESKEDRVRYRARIELSSRSTDEVIGAVDRWAASLDDSGPEHEHHLLEALWLHQFHNVVSLPRLERMLASPDFRARAAAVRVLCDWREQVPDILGRLLTLAEDEHPRVRLEVVRAASFLTQPEAIEIPLLVAERPTDEYIDFVIKESLRPLEPLWDDAVSRQQPLALKTEAGMRYYLRKLSNEELLTQERTRGVYVEMIRRDGLRDDQRMEAVAGLARLDDVSELRILLNAIQDPGIQAETSTTVFDLVRLLTQQPLADLQAARNELLAMSKTGALPIVRQIGYVALIAADGTVDAAWQQATESVATLRDLVGAMPLIPDPNVRANLYERVIPLLDSLPESLADAPGASTGAFGRYVRIELPGDRRTLTLAEVEVISGGTNVARTGNASQSSTANGGVAQRAVDGNKNPSFGGGGQTHTTENRQNPWWEVDLGQEYPIDSIAVYNRDEGNLGRRLDGFTLQVLNSQRQSVFEQKEIPAPKVSATFQIPGGGSHGLLRRAAMTSLTSVRGKEGDVFKRLAGFIRDGIDRDAAIVYIQRIPQRFWPGDEALPLANALVDYIKTIPPAERTSPPALNAQQLGDALASMMAADEGQRIRRLLGELGVRVIRIGTVPHQMAYDREQIAVQAGKPVEFLLENPDIMPHNFAITRPGRMAEIGELAEATAQAPDAARRHYIPTSGHVLLASRLLQTRETQRLSWTAPSEPGVYPYVCTYPGHWRRMYGALYVVADLEAYEADPEGYVKAHKLEIQDDLLQYNRPRQDWTFDELASAVRELGEGGRSFSNGKQMFTIANCIACHRMHGEGQQIGQDLTKLDAEKMPPVEILRHILEPSLRIDDKFATYAIELESGRIVTGIIIEETDETLKLIENPLNKTDAQVIRKSEIAEKLKSPTSIMPAGLLSKLTHTEILDLIAYVAAKGNEKSAFFGRGHGQGGQHGHHH